MGDYRGALAAIDRALATVAPEATGRKEFRDVWVDYLDRRWRIQELAVMQEQAEAGRVEHDRARNEMNRRAADRPGRWELVITPDPAPMFLTLAGA